MIAFSRKHLSGWGTISHLPFLLTLSNSSPAARVPRCKIVCVWWLREIIFYREEKSIQFTDVWSNTGSRNGPSRPRVRVDLAAVNRTPQCVSDGGHFSIKSSQWNFRLTCCCIEFGGAAPISPHWSVSRSFLEQQDHHIPLLSSSPPFLSPLLPLLSYSPLLQILDS